MGEGEAEACGCVCCHTTGIAPNGAAAFDTAAEGIWTDTFTTRGLAIAADGSILLRWVRTWKRIMALTEP